MNFCLCTKLDLIVGMAVLDIVISFGHILFIKELENGHYVFTKYSREFVRIHDYADPKNTVYKINTTLALYMYLQLQLIT